MVDGHPVNRLDELLPWAWKPEIHVQDLTDVQAPDAYVRLALLPLSHIRTCDIARQTAMKCDRNHCHRFSLPRRRGQKNHMFKVG
jgi:hypothetical protein